MLFKILAFLAVLIAIYLIFFKTRVKRGVKCGTFIEAKDAVISGGGYVCRDCMQSKKE